MIILSFRSWARWLLGYPDAALADTDDALKDAREIGQAATLMFALLNGSFTHMLCGNYAAANAEADELVASGRRKGRLVVEGVRNVDARLSSCTDRRSLGGSSHDHLRNDRIAVNGGNILDAVVVVPFDKRLCGTRPIRRRLALHRRSHKRDRKEQGKWCEAEVNRVAGEITLMSPEPDAAKAEAYFERALAVAREQQAKSWELRAAMSMARLWREQGKRSKPTNYLLRSMAGLPKVSTRSI